MPSRNILIGTLLCTLALGSAGCRKRSVHAAPPAIVSVPPVEPAPEPKPEVKPESKPDAPPSPAPTISVPPAKPAPARPRPAPPEPVQPKPAPPQLSPRLTPEQQAEAEKHTYDDIALAEKNVLLAAGRTLNSAQQDLVEKVRGFIGQAREAIRASDWVRARNLAQKAQVLSNELVNSL